MWETAAENFKKSQIIYENLVKIVQATTGDEELCDLFKSKIEELNPNLRYCAYNLSGGSGTGKSIDELLEMRRAQGGGLLDLDALITPQTKQMQEQAAAETVEWRDRKIQIRLPEKLRLFLLTIQDLDKSVEHAKSLQDKIDLIETVLIDCKDCIQTAKDDLLKQDPKAAAARQTSGSGSAAAPVSSNMQILLAYLNYIRLIRTLERNLYLIGQAKQNISIDGAVSSSGENTTKPAGESVGGKKTVRPQNLTRLYEIIAQNVVELQQIPGLENDTAYQNEIKDLSVAFKAFRCYYIAMTLISLFRWRESVAMFERK